MPIQTTRSLTKDTKPLKNDLERIITVGEKLLKSAPSYWQNLKYGLVLAGSIFGIYDNFQTLKKEVEQDQSIQNKTTYYAEVVRESTNHLAKYIIGKYL